MSLSVWKVCTYTSMPPDIIIGLAKIWLHFSYRHSVHIRSYRMRVRIPSSRFFMIFMLNSKYLGHVFWQFSCSSRLLTKLATEPGFVASCNAAPTRCYACTCWRMRYGRNNHVSHCRWRSAPSDLNCQLILVHILEKSWFFFLLRLRYM
jgi:hypothetical protein